MYVNSKGQYNVQKHVEKVFSYMPRFKAFFRYLYGYANYLTLFPGDRWDYNKFQYTLPNVVVEEPNWWEWGTD
jgi:hypothetical protein